ncbi:MAG: protein jag [Acidobacteriota bacterium]
MSEVDLSVLKPKVETFISELIDKSSLDLKVVVSNAEPEAIAVNFQGLDLPLLLGHNAELLDALQYVTRRAFASDVAVGLQIDFDAGGYRDSRRQELELMAQKAAERVRQSRVPFVFDPMNAQDRRIIHTILVDVEGIRTESEGDGQLRRVKVLPG